MMWKRSGRAAAAMAAVALLIAAGACSKTSDSGNKGGAESTTPQRAEAEPAAAPSAAEAAPAKPALAEAALAEAAGRPMANGPKTGNETKEYKIELIAPEQVTAGSENALSVIVTPKAGWHFNLEFPTSVKVQAPAGMKVAKPVQKLDDAVEKSEEEGAVWKIAVTPDKPGSGKLECKVKFAVCTETTCDPKKETLALQLEAK